MPQETYLLLSLDEGVDEDRNASTRYAPFTNMLSAAQLVVSLLEAQQDSSRIAHITHRPAAEIYAILGGFSMQLRGGRQSTRDIDIVTSVRMKGVWTAITGEDRIVMPDSRLVEGVVKIFVKTGFRSSPRKLDDHLEVVGPFDFFGQRLYFNILDIASMMRIQVECCLSRAESRDFEDVRYMINSHASQVSRALEAGIFQADDLAELLIIDSWLSSQGRYKEMALTNHGARRVQYSLAATTTPERSDKSVQHSRSPRTPVRDLGT
nr:hypothetical protein CFP56_16813 [Quercus suber]